MSTKHSLPPNMNSWPFYSSHFAFFVLISIPFSSSFDSYTTCSNTFNCGGITKVGFPFWGDGRPDNCGYPELKLACSHGVTTIEIMGVKYRLLKINQDEQTLKVVRDDYYDKICSPKFGDTKLDSNLFDYVFGSSDFTLLYDCASSSPAGGFKCPDNETYANVAAVPAAVPGTPICKSKVVVRISGSTGFGIISIQNVTALEAAVREGFEVKYKVDSGKCDECVGSKGVCGYDWNLNDTVCHCPNQTSEPRNCSAARTAAINSPAAVPLPPAKESSMIIIVGALGSVAFCSLVVVVAGCFFRKRLRTVKEKYHSKRQKKKVGNDMKKTVESLQFRLGTIETATNKFSDDNKLGEGGFGAVFKGTLGNGHEIAVKRLSKSSTQGVQEFQNEVVLVAKLQHRNLVRLLGFCLEGEETLLVYEYVPNKSLDKFLFEPKKREQLDWPTRCMIIGGIARGILYLHEDSRLRVIHRDLKASNILLDDKMNPKISDFGMAKMFGIDGQTQGNTKRVVGTLGYMAPEYAIEGIYSVKSDVFSFGILLLEITTGRKNFLGFDCRFPTLLAHAWQSWNEGKGLDLIDPILLKDSCRPDQVLRYIHIGLLCVQEDANIRPTMSSVVLMLKTETISLSKPERPAFFTGRSANMQDQIAANSCTINGFTISDDLPR